MAGGKPGRPVGRGESSREIRPADLRKPGSLRPVATRRDNAEYYGAWRAYYRSLVDAGVYVGGEPLHAPETGTTVRHRDGRKQIQDGPYANTKEQLAGFILLELPSLDAALEWASRCPATRRGRRRSEAARAGTEAASHLR